MVEDKRTPTQKERNEKVVNSTLEFVVELDEEAVKRWITERWPHGDGLYQ